MFRNLVFTSCLAVMFVGCSQGGHSGQKLFYGDCKVSVKAQPDEAEIVIDGIPVGHKKVSVEIPCGEKQILVEMHGYKPFYQYLNVSKEKPLEVAVTLEREKQVPDYALSNELVEQVRQGKKLRNPFKESHVAGEKGAVDEKEEEKPITLDIGAAATSSSSAGGGGTLPPGDINSVDYWR